MLHTRLRSSGSLGHRLAGGLALLSLWGLAGRADADLAPPAFRRGDPLAGPVNSAGGAEVISGSIDKEVIRRVIRRHINEIRYCYEKELSRNPTLAGTVSVSFRISTTGAVDKSEIKSSTLNNAEAESCIATRVLSWMFPAPQGGPVAIVYPFVLRSAADATGQPTTPSGGNPSATPATPASAAIPEPPAGAPTWLSFAAYPGARMLCHEHVRGAGPRPMEIEWFLFAVAEPQAKVSAYYERDTAHRAVPESGRAGVGLTSARNARDKMSIFPTEKASGYPSCASKARPGERTLILVSRGIGG